MKQSQLQTFSSISKTTLDQETNFNYPFISCQCKEDFFRWTEKNYFTFQGKLVAKIA